MSWAEIKKINSDLKKPLDRLIDEFKNDTTVKLDALIQSKDSFEYIIIDEQKYKVIRKDEWEKVGSTINTRKEYIEFVGKQFFVERYGDNYRALTGDNVLLTNANYSMQSVNNSAIVATLGNTIYVHYLYGSSFSSRSITGSYPILIDAEQVLYINSNNSPVLYNFKTGSTVATGSNGYSSPLIKLIKDDLLYISTSSGIHIFNYPSLTFSKTISAVGGSSSEYMRFLEDSGKIYYVSNNGKNVCNITDNKRYIISSFPSNISVYNIEIIGNTMTIYSTNKIYLCDLQTQRIISTKDNTEGNVTLFIGNFKDNTFGYLSGTRTNNGSTEYVNYAYKYSPKYTLKRVVG